MARNTEGKDRKGETKGTKELGRKIIVGDEEESVLEYLIITLQKPPGGK